MGTYAVLRNILIPCLAGALLAGCRTTSHSTAAQVSPAGWSSGDTKTVTVGNTDTLALRDIHFTLRHDGRLPAAADTLFFGITTITPDSTAFRETFAVIPSGTDGRNGFMLTDRIYRKDAVLNQSGNYNFRITPETDMPLEGVRAVGIEITDSDGKR